MLGEIVSYTNANKNHMPYKCNLRKIWKFPLYHAFGNEGLELPAKQTSETKKNCFLIWYTYYCFDKGEHKRLGKKGITMFINKKNLQWLRDSFSL